ncbi:MAG TPA: YetF domain-containing protein [Caulobacteraceae bacterium]|nr:YetF domain-containing protein [Caulobacteraceae bacterium]
MTVYHILAMGAPPLTWAQMSARAITALIFDIIVVRLFGRRIFARWSALDVVIAVSMGSRVSRAITGPIAFWPAIAATTIMLIIHRALAISAVSYPGLGRLLEGRPVRLGRNGALDERTMRLQGVTRQDVAEALRAHGIETIGEAKSVTLEPNGLISAQRTD